jgi:hypothetical protein
VVGPECNHVGQQSHRPVRHPGHRQQPVVQQPPYRLDKLPVRAVGVDILKDLLAGGVPASCLPQEVIQCLKSRIPLRRRPHELIGHFQLIGHFHRSSPASAAGFIHDEWRARLFP